MTSSEETVVRPMTTGRLVADIGGTWIRFGLVGRGEEGTLHSITASRCEEYRDVAEAVRDYLRNQHQSIDSATLAVASPVTGDRVHLTNSDWSFSQEELRDTLELDRLDVVNDFAALAQAIPLLSEDETRVLNAGRPAPGAPVVVIGPGTGLGVSAALPYEHQWLAIESEGGHRDLGATNETDWQLLQALQRRFGHVSAERVLSGDGLVNLHRALAEIDGVLFDERLTAAELVERARDGAERPRRTTRIFSSWLGAIAGDLVLTYGALGGLYLGGGVILRMGDAFDEEAFLVRFEDKGRFRDYLRSVPVRLILDRTAALRGAARWRRGSVVGRPA